MLCVVFGHAQSTEGSISRTWDDGYIPVNDPTGSGPCESMMTLTLPSTKDFYRIQEISIQVEFESIAPVWISDQALSIISDLIYSFDYGFDVPDMDVSGTYAYSKTITFIPIGREIQDPGAELEFILRGRQTYLNSTPDCSTDEARITSWTVQVDFCVDDADCDNYPYYNDCNDNWAPINPGATEHTCDGLDNNCDGQVDEGTPVNIFNGNISNQWFDAHNWSLERLPMDCDKVVIPDGESVILGGRVSNDYIELHSLAIENGGELITSFITIYYLYEISAELSGQLSCGPSTTYQRLIRS